MKFLVDADLPPMVAYRLRELGYDCSHVREIGKANASDEEIFELVQHEERAIITKDRVFANVSQFPLSTHHGVIRVRAHQLRREALAELVAKFLTNWREEFDNTLVILEPGYVRVRRE